MSIAVILLQFLIKCQLAAQKKDFNVDELLLDTAYKISIEISIEMLLHVECF